MSIMLIAIVSTTKNHNIYVQVSEHTLQGKYFNYPGCPPVQPLCIEHVHYFRKECFYSSNILPMTEVKSVFNCMSTGHIFQKSQKAAAIMSSFPLWRWTVKWSAPLVQSQYTCLFLHWSNVLRTHWQYLDCSTELKNKTWMFLGTQIFSWWNM